MGEEELLDEALKRKAAALERYGALLMVNVYGMTVDARVELERDMEMTRRAWISAENDLLRLREPFG